jgi:hypothetical protein
VIFTVPAISLIDQTIEKFGHEGIRDVGVIQADHPLTDYAKPVQTASVVCPSCGFKPEPKCTIVNREGELIELTDRRTIAAVSQAFTWIKSRQIAFAKAQGHAR